MMLSVRHVHVIGVGGIGTSGIAKMLLARGVSVSGSDLRDSAVVEELRGLGAVVRVGHTPENVPAAAELVVVSAAVEPENLELREADRRRLPVLKYAQALGQLMSEHTGIAVAGTHGKSTTTAMVAYMLKRSGLDPSFVVGAGVPQLGGSSGVGTGPHFVAEACEYDRSFLNLSPAFAVITNIEEDHLDYYRDLEEIVQAFGQFARRLAPEGLLVVNGQDPAAVRAAGSARARVETVALGGGADWQAVDLQDVGGCYAFSLRHPAGDHGRFTLRIPGLHYVADACAALAVSLSAGADPQACREALAEFRGAARRFDLVGEAAGLRVVDDYAHHPTEIQATLRAARQRFPQARLWCVFQPHQHSRTRFLLADFARSFHTADRVLLPDIYFVRDSDEERRAVSSADLVAAIHRLGRPADEVRYLPTFEEIEEVLLREVAPGDVLITMGAGDVWKLGRRLLQRLGADCPAACASGASHHAEDRR